MSPRFSLLAKIYLSTAGAATLVFAGAGWFFEHQASQALHDGVEQEVRASLGTIDATMQSRAEHLSIASALIASMSDVRAAFGTRDQATIGDTAGEMWTRASAGHADAANAAFTVADPSGVVLASVGGQAPAALQNGQNLSPGILEAARKAFPHQSAAFAVWDGSVWQIVATPVYVDSGTRAALLSILLAAYPLTDATLRELKERTGGSDFLLRVNGRTLLTTYTPDVAGQVQSHPEHFAIHPTVLRDASGSALAELWAVRSYAVAETRVAALRRTMVISWVVAMTVGLALSYLLARRIVRPIRALNQAAQQVSREDFSTRVPETSQDELGALARTFNQMSAAIEQSRAEQIRSGQIAAVARLSASIAHDLRNPLAAVVGGSEMLAEFDLPPDQIKQTAGHIHKAALHMDQLLSEIGQVARAGSGQRVLCTVTELVHAAVEAQEAKAQAKNVSIHESVQADLSVMCEKLRVERVLVNLIANAIDVLKDGGAISIDASRNGDGIHIDVSDNGPGVPVEIKDRLFQPFVTAGKRNGLGLGLALARQTMLDHNGDLELVPSEKGAHFRLRLPSA